VSHLNRTGIHAFLRHQQRLGRAFAEVCACVDFPRRWFTHPWLTPIAPGIRLLSVGTRVRHDLRQAVAALLLSPLLVLGAVAWVAGLAEGRRVVNSRRAAAG